MPIDNFPGAPPRNPLTRPSIIQTQGTLTGASGTAATVNSDGALAVEQNLNSTDAFTETVVNISAIGDNTLVAAVALKKTYLYRAVLTTTVAVNVTFKSAATSLTGAVALSTTQPFVLTFATYPWLTTTAVNQSLILNASTTASIQGWISTVTV